MMQGSNFWGKRGEALVMQKRLTPSIISETTLSSGTRLPSYLTSTSLRIAPPVCELHGFSRVKIDNLSMFHGCHCNDRIVFTDLDMEY